MMDKDLIEKISAFRLSMNFAKTMLSRGIITDEDYEKIRTILLEKYELSLSTLCL